MSESLYEDLILEHNKHPHHYGKLDMPDRVGEGSNPLCGDQITVYLQLEGETISQIRFSGKGCAITRASASLMTCAVAGKTCRESRTLARRFEQVLTGAVEPEMAVVAQELGDLGAFVSLRRYPMRLKCALLPWRALSTALDDGNP